jgi:hypothetical protein
MREASLQSIYTSQLSEATMRLLAAKKFLATYIETKELPEIEAAILQLRKALETIAFAAIAPDKQQYVALRAKMTESPDFTRDYHAAKIFTALAKINTDFYPVALMPAVRQPDNSWFYDKKKTGFLTKKRFERVYDRLGKHLHAHNPWSVSKHIQNLAAELPSIIDHAHGLLDLHARFIRTPGFEGVWIFEADRFGNPPRLMHANSMGPYVVT